MMAHRLHGLLARRGTTLPLLALLTVSRCTEVPRHAVVPTPAHAVTATPAARPLLPEALDANGKPILFNDPPAPPDTPLCGRQAREADAIGASLLATRLSATGICASFTCYDPLTATYIGADGYHHVCR